MPEERRNRLIAEYGLPLYDANLLTASKAMADYFEDSLKTDEYKKLPRDKAAKEVSNWLLGETSRIINANNTDIEEFRKRVRPEHFLKLIAYSGGTINMATAKTVLEEMFKTGADADNIIREKALGQISDDRAIEAAVLAVITDNRQAVADYKEGKEQALKFLVGQVMRASKGRANPQIVNEMLKRKLEEG